MTQSSTVLGQESVAKQAGVAFVRGFATAAGLVAALAILAKWGSAKIEKNVEKRLNALVGADG